MQCKVCGQDNPTEARFCGNCGATLPVRAEAPAPAVAPAAAVAPESLFFMHHMGFWIRFAAALIDAVIVSIISGAINWLMRYGGGTVFGILLPLLYYWLFTGLRGQTPGKMALGIKVVNARGDRPGLGGAALREILGKLISTIVLCIGFLWIAWDKNKQGWHDWIASTYVVKAESRK